MGSRVSVDSKHIFLIFDSIQQLENCLEAADRAILGMTYVYIAGQCDHVILQIVYSTDQIGLMIPKIFPMQIGY